MFSIVGDCLLNGAIYYGTEIATAFLSRQVVYFTGQSQQRAVVLADEVKIPSVSVRDRKIIGKVMEGIDFTVSDRVKEVVLLFFGEYICAINDILRCNNKGQYLIKCESTDTLQEKALKCARGVLRLKSELGDAGLEALSEKLNYQIKVKEEAVEEVTTGMFFSRISTQLFLQFLGYQNQRRELLKINFHSSEATVGEIIEVESCISEIEKLSDYYFSKLRVLMDESIDYDSKLKQNELYSMVLNYKSLSNEKISSEEISRIFTQEIINSTAYIVRLQIVLDCLKRFEKAPKTEHNGKVVLKVLEECLEFFKEDREEVKFIKQGAPNDARNHYSVIVFIADQVSILKKGLERIKGCEEKKEVAKVSAKREGMPGRSVQAGGDDWGTSVTRDWEKQFGKGKETQARLLKERIRKEEEKKKSSMVNFNSYNKKSQFEGVLPIVENLTHADATIGSEIKNDAELGLKAGPLGDIDEDNEEAIIEREAEEMMTLLFQLFEGDRQEKQVQKAAKLQGASKAASVSILPVKNVCGPIINLGNTPKETLKELFAENPGNLTIHNSRVQAVIKQLGGRWVGEGNGSRYKVLWGTSRKQVGMFEAHGGEYLKSEWAFRAAGAIKAAAERYPNVKATVLSVVSQELYDIDRTSIYKQKKQSGNK